MKKVLFLSFFLLLSPAIRAQNPHPHTLRPFEGEVGAGMIIDVDKGGLRSPFGFSFFAEGRHNFRNSGFDMGAQLFLGRWTQEWFIEDASTPTITERHTPLTFTVYGDYNFRRLKNVSIFVGAGPAFSLMLDRSYLPEYYLTLSTRAGVELFHHYRLTFDYRMLGSGYQFYGINFGYVFGGGPRR